MKKITRKTRLFLYICPSVYGESWELFPKLIHLLWVMAVHPLITYGTIPWWQKAQQLTATAKFNLKKVYQLRELRLASHHWYLKLFWTYQYLMSIVVKKQARLTAFSHTQIAKQPLHTYPVFLCPKSCRYRLSSTVC